MGLLLATANSGPANGTKGFVLLIVGVLFLIAAILHWLTPRSLQSLAFALTAFALSVASFLFAWVYLAAN